MTIMQMLTDAEAAHPIVLDGGLGTALETRGVDLDHGLWSADLIREDPETLTEVHAEFIAAGARIVSTASYQATPLGFARADLSPAEGRELITRSVEIARSAAEAAAGSEPVLVAGSVGPFGAALGGGEEYTGDYSLTVGEFADFHRPRIGALVSAGVDMLALETQPRLDEIGVLLGLAEAFGIPAWVSVTLDASSAADGGTIPRLPDGGSLADLAETAAASEQIQAIGVNCVRPSLVAPALEELSTHADLPLIAYPNSGETYDADTMEWQGAGAEAGIGTWPMETWALLGARIIGGCCRVRPDDIAVLSQRTRR